MIVTSGDDCDKNCDLFDESMRKMAKFAKKTYIGYLAAKDLGDGNILRHDVVDDAHNFAGKYVNALNKE